MKSVQFTEDELVEVQSTLVEKMIELNLSLATVRGTAADITVKEIVKLGRIAEKCSSDPSNISTKQKANY